MAEWFTVPIRVVVGKGADGQDYHINWLPETVNINISGGLKVTDAAGNPVQGLPLMGGKYVVMRGGESLGEHASLAEAMRTID